MKVTIMTSSLLAFLFAFPAQILAVDFTVNLTTDQHDASTADGICDIDLATAGEQCSLRAAVEQANELPSNDRVLFNLSANSTITETTANGGEIMITNNGTLEILGTGANNLTIDGGVGTNRIFTANFASLIISGVTLTGGNGTSNARFSGVGGAIFSNNGISLTLDSVHVTGNSVGGSSGGGVYFSGGTNRIVNSTFSTNTAFNCGGFATESSTTIINSTISGNTATGGSGGGFCSQGNNTAIMLRNVTITNNTAGFAGGGISSDFGTMLNFGNTIVAGNTAPSGSFPEIQFGSGTITSAGGNLVGDSAGDSTNTNNPITYQMSDIQNTNPLLGALTIANGGTTPTRALLAGSPAIDKGLNALAVDPSNGNAALTTDQRGAGFPRIIDGNGDLTATVDIGAFEAPLRTTAASVSISGRVTTAKGRGINRAYITMIDANGETRNAISNSFGYYYFINVPAGETVIFSVSHKSYAFNQSNKVRAIVEETNDVNFVADDIFARQIW